MMVPTETAGTTTDAGPTLARVRPGRDWRSACKAAEAAVLEQLIQIFEDERKARGLTVAEFTARAHLSKRMVGLTRKLKASPRLRSLISMAEALDLQSS